MEMFADTRFNPFEEAVDVLGGPSFKKKLDELKEVEEIGIPVRICFRDTAGHRSVYSGEDRPSFDWVDYDESKYIMLYYSGASKDNGPIGKGWVTNRMSAMPYESISNFVKSKAEYGLYINYPANDKAGEIYVEVLFQQWLFGNENDSKKILGAYDGKHAQYPYLSWLLIKAPIIDIVKMPIQPNAELDSDDMEYSAELEADASDPLEIDTICGTCAEGMPGARGVYYNTSTYAQITKLTRSGRTTQVEELLIGTLYSQYAHRRTTLEGEMELQSAQLRCYTEANQGSSRFLIIGESQNLINDTTDAKIIELRPDEYTQQT